MRAVGPDAPTLCGDGPPSTSPRISCWRERRLDAAPGIMARHWRATPSAFNGASRHGVNALLGDVESGPPIWSPFHWVDEQANLAEIVRPSRGRPPSARRLVRTLPPECRTDCGSSRRESAAAVTDTRRSASSSIGRGGDRVGVRKAGDRTVTLRGEPAELLLHAFGRDQVRVEFVGSAEDVAAVTGLDRSL